MLLGSPISCVWIVPEQLLSRGDQQAGQPRINEAESLSLGILLALIFLLHFHDSQNKGFPLLEEQY